MNKLMKYYDLTEREATGNYILGITIFNIKVLNRIYTTFANQILPKCVSHA